MELMQRHVVAVQADVKVIDEAAAISARHRAGARPRARRFPLGAGGAGGGSLQMVLRVREESELGASSPEPPGTPALGGGGGAHREAAREQRSPAIFGKGRAGTSPRCRAFSPEAMVVGRAPLADAAARRHAAFPTCRRWSGGAGKRSSTAAQVKAAGARVAPVRTTALRATGASSRTSRQGQEGGGAARAGAPPFDRAHRGRGPARAQPLVGCQYSETCQKPVAAALQQGGAGASISSDAVPAPPPQSYGKTV